MTIFFLFLFWGTHLSSFFTFLICFKCQMTIECLMLSSLATSVVIRGSAFFFFFLNMKRFMNLCVILAQGPCWSLYRSNFSICAAKASTKISFDGCSRLVVVNFWWPATMLLLSIISSPLHNFLNHHCTVHWLAVCWAKCIVDVVSYLCCFTTHFELKKIAWICFLSNIISIV